MSAISSKEFKDLVVKWYKFDKHYEKKKKELDDIVSQRNIELKNISDMKDNIENSIIGFMSSNKMENNTIQIGDENIKYKVSSTSIPVSKKHIEKRLTKYFGNSYKSKEILAFIYDNRPKNKKIYLKRT